MKRRFLRVLSSLLVVVMIVGSAPLSGFVGLDLPNWADLFTLKADAATESGTCGDNLTWSLDTDTGVLDISGTGAMYNWSSYTNVPWYSNRSSIKTVVIGDSVTSIGGSAFMWCDSLTSVTIPDSVTSIGSSAFYNTGIYNNESNWENDVLYIGNHLIQAKSSISGDYLVKSGTKIIADYAFYECDSLTKVTIPDSVTSIGNDAFYDCNSLTSVTIGESVTSIGNYAFYNCYSLTSVEIPDSVTSIGNYAFEFCTSLTSVTIPDSVTSIGKYAFYDCGSLTSVNITDISAWCGIAFDGVEANPLYYAKNLYLNNKLATDLIIPNNVTSIGNYTFISCACLRRVIIPDSVTSIGESAFTGCNSLTDVYYTGIEDEWNKISIGSGNDYLLNATIHYSWIPACFHTSCTEHTTPATCEAEGESYKLCNDCGKKIDVKVIPVLGHSYGEWEVIKEATYFASGEKIRKCVKCGAVLESAEIPQLELNMSITTPSTTTIKYGDSIILHTEFEGTLPDGARIEWTADNDCFSMSVSEDGTTCEISPKSSGKTTFTVTVYDTDGNEIASSSQEMTSKAGFFYKFIAFFKKLFGLLKVIPYTI